MPPRLALYSLIDETAQTHQPIIIAGKRGSAVLVSEENWRSIDETLHLLSVTGMGESIREGMATPIAECANNDSEEMRLYADLYRNQSR